MRVATILENKGSAVATISGTATLAEAAGELRLRGVGALVVSMDGRTIEGIVSERDVVRRLAERGAQSLDEPVSMVMTTEVRTCRPSDTCNDLMRVMTQHRMRHPPGARRRRPQWDRLDRGRGQAPRR
ncbi:MAG: CBS domain-containing protein [Microthrixaceae bacterium]|nr:CBS domain-containing protein [Microthrixaceae bacterium]